MRFFEKESFLLLHKRLVIDIHQLEWVQFLAILHVAHSLQYIAKDIAGCPFPVALFTKTGHQ